MTMGEVMATHVEAAAAEQHGHTYWNHLKTCILVLV